MPSNKTMMNPVGIIGGMGPFAGAHYVGLFLDECVRRIGQHGGRVADQSFPPHYLFQQPVPDRTSALLGSMAEYARVLYSLARQIESLRQLSVRTIAMSCNTAHAWHADLQAMNA